MDRILAPLSPLLGPRAQLHIFQVDMQLPELLAQPLQATLELAITTSAERLLRGPCLGETLLWEAGTLGARTQTCFPEVQLQLESRQRLPEGSRCCARAFAPPFSGAPEVRPSCPPGLRRTRSLGRLLQTPFRTDPDPRLQAFCTLPPELTHASSFWHPRSAHPCCKRTQLRTKHSA